ncbi:RHS repeat domain-containing protein [Pseudomonas atagonensis]|uniref:RHS repeat domain-containing protein n=1 Tax=Pseudomonas atagonensis TaxID=2609964 RepID=UPI00140CDA88|nr:RHS repeat-associated core domain-containing protein [Pseudomonas atagonensis]
MDMHRNTPRVTAVDPRGLAARTIDYWRADVAFAAEARINRILYDAAGRAVKQWDPRLWALQANDPLAPANLISIYALNGQELRSDSVDAGVQTGLPGPGAEVLRHWDSRGTHREVRYDRLLRPVAVFEEGRTQLRHCIERFEYGHPGAGDSACNQFGQLIEHCDPAGSVLSNSFALGGDCLENTRHYTLDPVLPDWPSQIEDRRRLLEPGVGATTRLHVGVLGQVLEQVDARGNRHGLEWTVDGHLRARQLQLKDQGAARTLVSDIQYNAAGQVTQEVAGNGVRSTLTYRNEDSRLLIRHTSDPQGRVLQHLTYDYDPMGNLLRVADMALPTRYFANQRIDPLSRFTYDSLYQLSEAIGWEAGPSGHGPTALANYRQTYCHDSGGNLRRLTHVGAQNPGHDLQAARYSNRCLPWRDGLPPDEAQIAEAFDLRGNLLKLDAGRTLTWNLRNQLHSVTPVERPGRQPDREVYLYDGQGLRVRKIRCLQTNARTVINEVRYLPELELRSDTGTGECVQIITVQTGLNSVRILHWESPPASAAVDQYRYGFTDHLGSICLELTADARILSREHFYPFGATAWSDGDVSYKSVRYSGKEQDLTGLYCFGIRYYLPWQQRWCNPDPKGFIDGPNVYQMVGNSPLTYVDIEGEKKTKAELLQVSASKQASLLEVTGNRAFDLKHSLLNTAYAGHRMKAAGRRMGAAAASSLLNGALETGGTAVGALAGPLGVKAGGWAGSKVADAVSAKVVKKYRLDRPIRLTGQEMNPKQIIEAVEPSKPRSLMTIEQVLKAMDPREKEGRIQLGKNIVDGVVKKGVDKVGKKLGVLGPETLKVGFEVAVASMGLKAQVLSDIHDDISTVIDLLEYRMDAIRTEFGESGSADEEVFGQVADLSVQTQQMVETLRKRQGMIELLAPSPYAGRRQSVSDRSGGKSLVRRASVG